MTATVIPFPKSRPAKIAPAPIRVCHGEDGDWVVITHRGYGWPAATRDVAINEAFKLARELGTVVELLP